MRRTLFQSIYACDIKVFMSNFPDLYFLTPIYDSKWSKAFNFQIYVDLLSWWKVA